MSAHQTKTEPCPYCQHPACEADWVDVGVGLVQCGPFVCPECGASEVGPHDTNTLDPEEEKLGWFKPNHFGTSANTFKGRHIGHVEARALYRAGLTINDHRDEA